ncbi:hypothetical protein OKW22_001339 [Bacilli bacterium PM5-3]|nr:hypothetical protein [Bacilli bacterium PM5-3]MDH6603782.1 hypothetical protein [Bacilli bacterium PM5-9]
MKKKLFIFGILLSFIFGVHINANVEDYVDNETPSQEKNEKEYIPAELPRARAALTVAKEGLYDTIKETKNASGVMTERRYYYKSKLVEKRTYTSTASSNCRMRNKYLYYSDGATVERHRTYSNTGDTCYNLQTKVYRSNKTISAHSIYEGKVGGKVIESRYYEVTGTYYTSKAFYKAGTGILYKRDYWKGAAPNRVTHTANFNAKGDEWINATYFHYPTDVKKEYVTFTGTSGANKRKTATGYDENGIKSWYRTYNANGDKYHVTYYNAQGIKTKEARYYEDTGTWNWEIKYQANGVNKTEEIYFRKNGTKELDIIYENNILYKKTYYDITGTKKVRSTCYNELKLIEEEITYYNNGYIKEELGYTGENPNILIYKSLYDEIDGKLNTEFFYDDAGNIIDEEKRENDVTLEFSEAVEDMQDIDYHVKIEDDRNVATFIDDTGFNIVVYNKKDDVITLNGEQIVEIEEIVYENNGENSNSIGGIETFATKTLVRTFKGILELHKIGNITAVAGAILVCVGGPASWIAAIGLATSILHAGLKKVYYTGKVYKTKVKKGKGKYTYKFSQKVSFYSNKARTNHIGTI